MSHSPPPPPPAPCAPQNVVTSANCQSDVLVTSWDAAPGALSYTMEALGNQGDQYNCSSSTNSCTMTGVSCGEVLSVWVTASDDDCTTDRVLGQVAETGEEGGPRGGCRRGSCGGGMRIEV